MYKNIVIIILILVVITLIQINQMIEPFTNIKLAIHTVFIIDENALFLEEWINYHLDLGFDEIYLYDNTGSKGVDGSSTTINKYNINFNEINNEKYVADIKSIIEENPHVHYITWQPKDENNNIVYGYNKSINNYITKYGSNNDWTAFIDVDEYIYLNNGNLKQYIRDKGETYNKIVIKQRKYEDRYCNLDKSIRDIDSFIDVNTDGWAPKNICKNINLNEMQSKHNMHSIHMSNEKAYHSDVKELRFNHYNVNKKQVKWMHGFLKTGNKPFKIIKDTQPLPKSNRTILPKKYNKKYYEENRHKFCADIF